MPLIERANSVLVVVDVQDTFLCKLPLHERGALVARIAWIMQIAIALEIPIVATAEDVSDTVELLPLLKNLLPPGQCVFNKMVFSLYGQHDIRQAIEALGKTDIVLVGQETDVCIAQSAIDLRDAGYQVWVADDATASPWPHHDAGLRRMENGGVVISNLKGIYYEWVRDVSTAIAIGKTVTSVPPDLTL
jgi:nicotinamidase-related amidase